MNETTLYKAFARAARCAILLLSLLFFVRVPQVGGYVAGGLENAVKRVLPSVFPLLVLSGLLFRSGAADMLGRIFGRAMPKVFSLPEAAFSAVFFGLVAGFPFGAKCASELYLCGKCSKTDAERIAAFCDFPSLPFMLFAVGKGVFGNAVFGLLLYGCQTVSALIFGMFYKRNGKKSSAGRQGQEKTPKEEREGKEQNEKKEEKIGFSILSSSVGDAVLQTLRVIGFVIFFSVVTGLLLPLFGSFPEKHPAFLPLFAGFLEFSSGVSLLTPSGTAIFSSSFPFLIAASSLICSFSGLSVFFQIAGILEDAGLSAKGYLVSRLFMLPAALLLSELAAKVFIRF